MHDASQLDVSCQKTWMCVAKKFGISFWNIWKCIGKSTTLYGKIQRHICVRHCTCLFPFDDLVTRTPCNGQELLWWCRFGIVQVSTQWPCVWSTQQQVSIRRRSKSFDKESRSNNWKGWCVRSRGWAVSDCVMQVLDFRISTHFRNHFHNLICEDVLHCLLCSATRVRNASMGEEEVNEIWIVLSKVLMSNVMGCLSQSSARSHSLLFVWKNLWMKTQRTLFWPSGLTHYQIW